MLIEKAPASNYIGQKNTSGIRLAFILVTTLFFLWGLSYGLLDVLNKHFQQVLHVDKAQSGLLQAAYFGAYFVMALPAGFFMDRYGYKPGILVGLSFYALGALLFVPATASESFLMFLFALFVIALGLGCLETAANPYVAVLGEPDRAEYRVNLAQSFNGLGQFFGPIIGGSLFFTATQTTTENLSSVKITYVFIAALVLLLILLIGRSHLPDIRDQSMDSTSAVKGLWQHSNFTGGIIAQFFYVAAQVGVGAFFINYTTEHWNTLSNQNASYLLSIGMMSFMIGRFFSTWLMRYVRPATLLAVYAFINILLCSVVVVEINGLSVIALIAVFFFMSIMFPTIFAMGIKNMSTQTRRASSVMIMAIVGGAIMPYLMGAMADHYTTAAAYFLPMICFAVVMIYGLFQRKIWG